MGLAYGYRPLAGALAVALGRGVFVADYRLAPEHPPSAAVDDAVRAYGWLLAEGTDPSEIVIVGDSAGAGLVVSLLVALRDRGIPLPGAESCSARGSTWCATTARRSPGSASAMRRPGISGPPTGTRRSPVR